MWHLALATLLFADVLGAKLPHLVIMLVDDLGYNAPGYRNSDLKTPTIDALAAGGVKLEEFYTYKFCSPTRASLLTGRMPYKLDNVQKNLIPWSLPAGTDLRFTMLPKKLKAAGYATHHIGKWHQGFFRSEYTPQGRGFDSTFGYLTGTEDHYTQESSWSVSCGTKGHDLWDNGQPAYGRLGRNKSDDARYNGYTFAKRAVDIIESHDARRPLFMYYALQNTHSPIEAPKRFSELYSFDLRRRNIFNGMVSVIDEAVANVTEALKRRGMWRNTFFVWTTDNGSPVSEGGSNEPLRGGKGSNWEGGVRVPFFATGGVLPDANRGKVLKGLGHVCDLYATFAGLAGLEAADPGHPAPVDGLDLFPWLAGQVEESPRKEVVLDHRMNSTDKWWGPTHGALRAGRWKLLAEREKQASWFGHFTPNETFRKESTEAESCSLERPCLFDVEADPTEHEDLLAVEEPSKEALEARDRLLRRMAELEAEYHPPPNPRKDEEGYCDNLDATGGFVTPWLDEGAGELLV